MKCSIEKRLVLAGAAALALGLFAGCQMCGWRPAIRPIDKACLPVGCSPEDLPLFRQDVDARYVQIAAVDSFAVTDCFPEEKAEGETGKDNKISPEQIRQMLEDLKTKARAAGADAVVRVKLLHNRLSGFKENPRTPFPSVMQGEWRQFFFRGIAVKFCDPRDRVLVERPARDLASPPLTASDRVLPERAGTLPIRPHEVPQAVHPEVRAPER